MVVGLGEVGRPLYDLLSESGAREVFGVDADASKSVDRPEDVPAPVDFLHVCYPYGQRFVEDTAGYVERFRPRYVIVHSTVVPGTTRAVHGRTGVPVAYSPVRGMGARIKKHLRFWPKWVSALPREASRPVAEHLEAAGLKVRVAECGPESLELAKLWETVYRAVMIAAWQELHRAARRCGADVTAIAEFVAEVHRVLGDRPVYYPGAIGGHCLIPNVRLMRGFHPSPLWDFVLRSNEAREKELGDPEVAREVEDVRRVWAGLVPRWYYGF